MNTRNNVLVEKPIRFSMNNSNSCLYKVLDIKNFPVPFEISLTG